MVYGQLRRVVPVDERAVRIVLPRPYMQLAERREPEPIWALKVMKELPHQFWLPLSRMSRVPLVGKNQKVGADQLQFGVFAG